VIKKERGLGRGLDALFFSSGEEESEITNDIKHLNLDLVIPNRNQPRKNFAEESLAELASSIKDHGILQPIIVRPVQDHYEIVTGERRWRAAKMLNLESIPAIVMDISDLKMAEISLVENLQREDLGVIEEAKAYQSLLDKYNYTQEKLAERIGKSRAHIANTIRLLNLPAEVIDFLDKNMITPGHARALLALPSAGEQINMARKIIASKASVRQTEEMVRQALADKPSPKQPKDDPEFTAFREKMEDYFGSKIKLLRGKKGGKIEIYFHDDDEFNRIIQLMGID